MKRTRGLTAHYTDGVAKANVPEQPPSLRAEQVRQTRAALIGAARRLFAQEAGVRAAAMLAGMLLFVILGQLLTLDMSLTLYMTVALAGFLAAQRAAGIPAASASPHSA